MTRGKDILQHEGFFFSIRGDPPLGGILERVVETLLLRGTNERHVAGTVGRGLEEKQEKLGKPKRKRGRCGAREAIGK